MMLKTGKLEEVKHIMKERNIDILSLYETRWQGNNNFNSDEFRVITSGSDTQEYRVVTRILKKKLAYN